MTINAPDSKIAFKTFEHENQIVSIDPQDTIYRYDKQDHDEQCKEKKWKTDPNYFKKVKISAVALIKMVMHTRSGGNLEVMGIMQGKISGDTMIIMDSFALPVEGTETRVNAAQDAFEYMVNYQTTSAQVGRLENAIGWYHSHPGYGCWLSGIDVSTQMLNQQYQEPWLAVVIDPHRTITAGRVELGAFRTYPKDYVPPSSSASEYQSIPLNKIEDFGVHANQYYQLDVSYFKSSLDDQLLELLWNKYWNRDYFTSSLSDLAEKISRAEAQIQKASMGMAERKKESPVDKIERDCTQLTTESVNGLTTQIIKNILFNRGKCCGHH